MPNDYGHEYADKELKSLEKRITKEYKQAAKEVEKKLNDYLAKFADKDAKMKKRLEAGEITASEYAEWRMRQMFTGDRWKAMSETLSADLVNVDKIAAGMINDSLPSSYAENFNYGTYEVEHGAKMNTNFVLYDKDTVINLMKDDPKIIPKANVNIPKDMVWNKRKIVSAVTQGILQGEAIPKIARRLQSVTDMDRRAAIRNARTYTTAAENKGRIDSYDRAKDMGINVKKEWLATLDERTRMEHRHLDGMAVDNDEPFEVDGYTIMYPGDPSAEPEMIYNCFIGDTSAYTNCDVVRSYAHQYDGDLIEIKTASGVNFTCTPNHPILTLNGWVSAASLHNGDDLLVTRIGNKFGFGRYCNIQHVFSSMKAFHDSFKRNGTIERNAALCVNFHGDIPTSEVEIVTQKRFLSNNGYPSFCESIKKFLLKLSDKTLFCKCTFMEHFRSVWLSTLGDIRSRSKLLSFLKRHLGHSEVHRLRPIALFDASGVKPLQNDVSGNIERISDCLNGFSGIVFADNIVNVNISSRCTHVYNLQTENGYYFVNSIISQKNKRCNGIVAISHNCRCTLVARIADYKYNDERNDSKLGDMTYEEWKHAKDKRYPKEEIKQEEKISGKKEILHTDDIKTYEYFEKMKGKEIEYIDVKEYKNIPTSEEIIEKLAGGDMTKGSCASLAVSYCANKCGLDVTDYRDGASRAVFSRRMNVEAIYKLANADIEQLNFTNRVASNLAKALEEKVEENKEYAFCAGKHEAIVRKVDGVLQYLELQSSSSNGWKDFIHTETIDMGKWGTKTYNYTVVGTLQERFGVVKSNRSLGGIKVPERALLIDVSSVQPTEEFKDILGLINTNEKDQKKGAAGSEK